MNIIVIVIYFIKIPLNLAFNEFHLLHMHSNSESTLGASFEDLGLLILTLDILVNLNTKIFDKGKEVSNRYKIYQYYKKNGLFSDLLGLVIGIVYSLEIFLNAFSFE